MRNVFITLYKVISFLSSSGKETEAMNNVECPEALLGTYRYNITTDAGTFCSDVTTATINACDVAFERTHLIVDNSGCSAVNPFNAG